MTMYKYECEYRDHNGRLHIIKGCNIFSDYNACDRAACDVCSDLVEKGYTEVQADIVEI